MTPAQLAAHEARLSARPRPLTYEQARVDLCLAFEYPIGTLPTQAALAARWGWSRGAVQRLLGARRRPLAEASNA